MTAPTPSAATSPPAVQAFAAGALYREFEGRIVDNQSLEDALAFIEDWSVNKRRVLAFRGVADADHGFFSSLYRRLWWTAAAKAGKTIDTTPPPTERELLDEEHRVLVEMHRWGLHDGDRGRLSILNQLAVLQHNHAPTRLIDISFNLWVSLWFAVEQRWDSGAVADDDRDGRLFIIDVTGRRINEDDTTRAWEDARGRPWLDDQRRTRVIEGWSTNTYVWQPSPADRRIAAQHGAFLIGGVPTNSTGHQYPRKPTPGPGDQKWLTAEEIRRCTSLPLRFHVPGDAHPGKPPEQPTFTYRIDRAMKEPVRRKLAKLAGLSTGRIYPDIAGFGKFGTPWLVDKRPT